MRRGWTWKLNWLPSQDSNLDQGIQSPLCYLYTTRQRGAEGRNRTGTGVAPQRFLRPSRLPIPPLRPEAPAPAAPEDDTAARSARSATEYPRGTLLYATGRNASKHPEISSPAPEMRAGASPCSPPLSYRRCAPLG